MATKIKQAVDNAKVFLTPAEPGFIDRLNKRDEALGLMWSAIEALMRADMPEHAHKLHDLELAVRNSKVKKEIN